MQGWGMGGWWDGGSCKYTYWGLVIPSLFLDDEVRRRRPPLPPLPSTPEVLLRGS